MISVKIFSDTTYKTCSKKGGHVYLSGVKSYTIYCNESGLLILLVFEPE